MKLQTKKIIFVGLAFMIISMFWQVYDNVIAKMLINSFGLNQTWSGIVMALDNVLALFMLPIFGALSDKTKTKYGKRTPYIFFGVIISAIFLVGVSIFDNIQNNMLKEQSVEHVVKVDDKLFDENSEYYYLVEDLSKEEQEQMLKLHGGDYWYKCTYTENDVKELFDFSEMNAEELRKVVKLTDTELEKSVFVELYNKYLKSEDLNEFSDILNDENRTIIDVTQTKGLLDSILGKDPVNTYTRRNLDRLEELELVLAKRILEQNDEVIEAECLKLGVREFFSEKEDATQARGKFTWAHTKGNIGYLIGFLGILLLVLLSMATFRTPAVSLMPDVTVKPLRSKANAIINLMGTVGGIIALGLMSFLSVDYHSYMLLFIVIGLLMIGILVVFLCTVNEPKLVEEMKNDSEKYGIVEDEESANDSAATMSKDVRKSFYLIILSIIFWFMAYNAATTKFSVYAGDILNMGYTVPLLIANATALIAFIPIGIIASKIGRKKTILAGVIILFIAFVLGCIATEKTQILIYFTMGIAGIGWATINVNSYPMVVEMSKGNNVGKYTGYYYTASMFAQILTPVLSGLVMDAFGTMKVLFPYSVVFCVLAFITMSFVKHGDSKPIANTSIEAFDVDD